MIHLAMLAALALSQAWTWTLYEGGGPLVLAHELPDTPQLRTVLECRPGSGVARIDVYGDGIGSGYAVMTSGGASSTGESIGGSGRQSIAVRTDHPVFGRFVASGRMNIAAAGRNRAVEMPSEHLAKLRRFAELCSG